VIRDGIELRDRRLCCIVHPFTDRLLTHAQCFREVLILQAFRSQGYTDAVIIAFFFHAPNITTALLSF